MANKASDTDLIGTNLSDILFAEAEAGRGRITVEGGAGGDVLFAGHTPVFVDAGAGNTFYDSAMNLDDPAKWTVGDDGLASNPAIPHATLLVTGAGEDDWFSLTLSRKTQVTFDVTITNTGGDTAEYWPGPFEDNVVFHTYWNHRAGDAWWGKSNTVTLPKGLQHFSIFAASTDGFVVPTGWSYVVTVSTKAHAFTAPVAVTGDDLSGGLGDDTLFGSAGDDRLVGGAGADRLHAGDGHDRLNGGAGSDTLEGGSGDDRLIGGAGADSMTGGAGADVFVIHLPNAPGSADTVVDFAVGEDRISLQLGAAYQQAGWKLDPSAFHLGATAADADDRILYDAGTGALLFDADGTGTIAAVQLATFANGAVLSAADFAVL